MDLDPPVSGPLRSLLLRRRVQQRVTDITRHASVNMDGGQVPRYGTAGYYVFGIEQWVDQRLLGAGAGRGERVPSSQVHILVIDQDGNLGRGHA
jgi:hypothetical protein